MIVLASSSPRRRQLLEMLGIEHEVDPVGVDETIDAAEAPAAAALRLARKKASAAAALRPDDHVLAADTIVVLDGEVLGKPATHADAARMLRRLSGRSHEVVTAVALAHQGELVSAHDVTRVTFRDLDDSTIQDYLATGESLDKAGAYGIQGYGAALVERVEGDFFGVMGFPVRIVLDLLADAGISYHFKR